MPGRILREGILSSIKLTVLDWGAEVFYRRVMSVVDDYGRFEAHPTLLRSRCYPLLIDRGSEKDIKGWMDACKKAQLIKVYKVESKTYLQIEDFNQSQRTASKCPAPPGVVDSKKAVKDMSDKEYKEHLTSRYPKKDVSEEWKKAEDWCGANNRQFTRKFFTAWLNRAAETQGKGGKSATGKKLEMWAP